MIKYVTFLAVGVGMVCLAHVQDSDVALAKVIYHFKHIDDTTQRDKPLEDEMVLYLGRESTLYRRVQEERYAEMEHSVAGGTDATYEPNAMLDSHRSYMLLYGENQSHTLEKIIDTKFHITAEIPAIDWQIADETKVIGGYTVQKATAHFRGRDYTAWFAADIPLGYGPWKLHGLPGLILEAEDAQGEVAFGFGGFETLESQGLLIRAPQGSKRVSQAEYDKTYQAFKENPEFFIKASGANNVVMGRPPAGFKPKVLNNPMELPEK